jgi:hypothetical protein
MKEKQTYRSVWPISIAAFILLYGLYLWLWIDPSLYLIRGYREFFTDGYFFREFFDFPGEPADYISRLLVQFYIYPPIASWLIFLCLIAIYFLGVSVYKNERIPFLPVFILLLMQNDYGHSIRFNVDILALSAALYLFTLLLKQGRKLMYAGYPALSAALFYINGWFAFITFLIAAFLLSLRKEKGACLLGLPAGAFAVFLFFYAFFSLSIHDLRQEFTDITRIYSFRYFPLILFASVMILPLADRFAPAWGEASLRKTKGMAVGMISSVCLLLFVTLDREERDGLSVQRYARNGEWEKTLQAAQKCRYPDINTVYYTNEALYHTGKIYDKLFSYNQSFGSEGLLRAEMSAYSEIVPNQEIFLQLGALSLSIIWGTEACNVYGANPCVLRNLTKAYLAGGYIREAQKTLNLLERTLFQKEWVKRYRKFVDNDALIRLDPELNRLREAQTPLAVVAKQSALMNLYLLAQDSTLNRMAYDYLLTGTLLDYQIENFAFCLSRLKAYGYTEIPKLYLEGLIYNTLCSPVLPVDMQDFTYDKTVLFRFSEFRNDLRALQQNLQKAQPALKDKYGDTYWYYLLFDSPISDEKRVDVFMKLTS